MYHRYIIDKVFYSQARRYPGFCWPLYRLYIYVYILYIYSLYIAEFKANISNTNKAFSVVDSIHLRVRWVVQPCNHTKPYNHRNGWGCNHATIGTVGGETMQPYF